MLLKWASAPQTNLRYCHDTHRVPFARSRYSWSVWVHVCTRTGQCRWVARMRVRASHFRGQCTHSYQLGREAENFLECSKQGLHVWGEYCATRTLDLTVWHWLFPPLQWASLSDSCEHTQQTHCLFSQSHKVHWVASVSPSATYGLDHLALGRVCVELHLKITAQSFWCQLNSYTVTVLKIIFGIYIAPTYGTIFKPLQLNNHVS